MSTAPRRPDLANEPVGRLMLRLSIPTITAQLVNMLYNLVDRIYISYIPDVGTLALTGLGVCLPIILLVSAFAALCASSGAPLASIAMGQRNHEKAEGILGSCTALLLCVSAVLTVILSCFYTPILLAFGATEDAVYQIDEGRMTQIAQGLGGVVAVVGKDILVADPRRQGIFRVYPRAAQ